MFVCVFDGVCVVSGVCLLYLFSIFVVVFSSRVNFGVVIIYMHREVVE